MTMLRNTIVLAACAAISACVPSSYMGVSTTTAPTAQEQRVLEMARPLASVFGGSCTDPATGAKVGCGFLPVSQLAMAAAGGDKHAQLALGKRFEAGRGVERDLAKAEDLYKRAAANSGGSFNTCVWDEYRKACNFVRVDLPFEHGLPEAKERLAALKAMQPAP